MDNRPPEFREVGARVGVIGDAVYPPRAYPGDSGVIIRPLVRGESATTARAETASVRTEGFGSAYRTPISADGGSRIPSVEFKIPPRAVMVEFGGAGRIIKSGFTFGIEIRVDTVEGIEVGNSERILGRVTWGAAGWINILSFKFEPPGKGDVILCPLGAKANRGVESVVISSVRGSNKSVVISDGISVSSSLDVIRGIG